MTILDKRDYYKPFNYTWAWEYYLLQSRKMLWTANEISFSKDIQQFTTLTEPEKEFIRKIFTFFVQTDSDVAKAYIDAYLPIFQQAEVRAMLLSFATMEVNHSDAYEVLVSALGFEDFQGFLKYPEMKEKHDYMEIDTTKKDIPSILKNIAVTSSFGEGLQLFGSFVMLLSFVERGLLPGAGDVVAYSLKDEGIHVDGMVKIFQTIKEEYPEHWTDDVKRSIYSACRQTVELEDRFISLVYTDSLELPNLPKKDLHLYIRYLADFRLQQLGLKPNYYVEENPIKWFSKFIGDSQDDLFQTSSSQYSRNSQDWGNIWNDQV